MLVGGVDAGMSASFTNMNIQGDVASLGGAGGAAQAGGTGGDAPQAAPEIKDIQLLSHATKDHLSAIIIMSNSDDPKDDSSVVNLAMTMYSAAAAMQMANQLNNMGAGAAGAGAAAGAAAGIAGIMSGGMMA